MKKIIKLSIATVLLLGLIGCTSNESLASESNEQESVVVEIEAIDDEAGVDNDEVTPESAEEVEEVEEAEELEAVESEIDEESAPVNKEEENVAVEKDEKSSDEKESLSFEYMDIFQVAIDQEIISESEASELTVFLEELTVSQGERPNGPPANGNPESNDEQNQNDDSEPPAGGPSGNRPERNDASESATDNKPEAEERQSIFLVAANQGIISFEQSELLDEVVEIPRLAQGE